MFDNASRQQLADLLGYERWMIKKALEIVRLHQGTVSELTIIVNDKIPHKLQLHFTDHIGANLAAEIVGSMSPMILVSSFKLSDMIFEWILDENNISSPGNFWSFISKIKTFQPNTTISMPDFLESIPSFFQNVLSLYIHIWPRRNAIIHGIWGTVQDGDLHFNFTGKDLLSTSNPKPAINFTDILTLPDLLLYAELNMKMSELLLDANLQTNPNTEALKYLSDKLVHIHKGTNFGVANLRSFKVIRRTRQNVVDLVEIRDMLNQQANGQPYVYSLTVEKLDTLNSWEFTDLRLSSQHEIDLSKL